MIRPPCLYSEPCQLPELLKAHHPEGEAVWTEACREKGSSSSENLNIGKEAGGSCSYGREVRTTLLGAEEGKLHRGLSVSVVQRDVVRVHGLNHMESA